MATDAVSIALSTFVGCVSGSVVVVHLAVLVGWSLADGLVVAVGRRGAVVGTQAISALVVFGRFNQPVPGALALGGLVVAGGAAELLFVALVRWPPPLADSENRRGARLSGAREARDRPADSSSIPVAVALDEAEQTLASPMLFADESIMRLRSLVDEGLRGRLALNAIRITRTGRRD